MYLHEPIPGWRNGLDPAAPGLAIRSMTRVRHRLGDALRLELGESGQTDPTLVHLQWFIATRSGPWAMWTTCAPDEVASREEGLAALTWFGFGEVAAATGEPLASVR